VVVYGRYLMQEMHGQKWTRIRKDYCLLIYRLLVLK
jgi:hypothetical protein